jgi:hypothetical protein
MSSVTGQIAQSLVIAIPYFMVLFVGFIFALVRWQRCPPVSALLVAALGTTLLTGVAYRIAIPLVVAGSGNTPISTVAFYLGVIGLVLAFVRTFCWAAVVAAVFGWRSASDRRLAAPLQFSIRGLIAVTFVVALFCGFGRIFVSLVGAASPALIQIVDDLPVVVCLGIGVWIAAARWSRHPHISLLAILSFATAITVTLVPQLLQVAVLQLSPGSAMLMHLLNIVVLLAWAVSWALAIIAALGWRPAEHQDTMPATPFPLRT